MDPRTVWIVSEAADPLYVFSAQALLGFAAGRKPPGPAHALGALVSARFGLTGLDELFVSGGEEDAVVLRHKSADLVARIPMSELSRLSWSDTPGNNWSALPARTRARLELFVATVMLVS